MTDIPKKRTQRLPSDKTETVLFPNEWFAWLAGQRFPSDKEIAKAAAALIQAMADDIEGVPGASQRVVWYRLKVEQLTEERARYCM